MAHGAELKQDEKNHTEHIRMIGIVWKIWNASKIIQELTQELN